jgi:hypothetical protein
VKTDPFEEKNVAAEQPKRVRELMARINAWWKVQDGN